MDSIYKTIYFTPTWFNIRIIDYTKDFKKVEILLLYFHYVFTMRVKLNDGVYSIENIVWNVVSLWINETCHFKLQIFSKFQYVLCVHSWYELLVTDC